MGSPAEPANHGSTSGVEVVVAVSGLPGHGKSTFASAAALRLDLPCIHLDQLFFVVNELCKRLHGETALDQASLRRFAPAFLATDEIAEARQAQLTALLERERPRLGRYYRRCVRGRATPRGAGAQIAGKTYDYGHCGAEFELIAPDLLDVALAGNEPVLVLDGYQLDIRGAYRSQLGRHAKVIDVVALRDRVTGGVTYRVADLPAVDLDGAILNLGGALTDSMASYQSFGTGAGCSPSDSKLTLLGLPERLDGRAVLDLGCNEGYFSFECERRGARVLGVEQNPKWFAAAQARKEQLGSFVDLRNLDWAAVPGLSHRFDLVLWLAAFHYVERDHDELLQHLTSVLRPGALLVLEVGLIPGDHDDIEARTRIAGDTCHYPTWPALVRLLEGAGFTTITRYGPGMAIAGDEVPRHVVHATLHETSAHIEPATVTITWDGDPSVARTEPALIELERTLLRLYHRHASVRWMMRAGHRVIVVAQSGRQRLRSQG